MRYAHVELFRARTPVDAGLLLVSLLSIEHEFPVRRLPQVAPVWLQGLWQSRPAVLVNYFLNSYWTFRDAERD